MKVTTLIMVICLFQIMLPAASSARSPLTAEALIRDTALKDHLNPLEQGEILVFDLPENETDTGLAVAMSVLIPAPLNETVDVLQRQSSGKAMPGIISAGEIDGDSSTSRLTHVFDTLDFSPKEKDETELLMEIGPGEEYNLSLEEIALFNKAAKQLEPGAQAEGMARTMGKVLKNRYLSYREKGLNGIAPYQISKSEQANPLTELVTATESIVVLKDHFPEYYRSMRFYPDTFPNITHKFFWVKQMEEDRPMFVLKHWSVDIQPDYALICERQFYMSHSLNSLQVVILCLPYKDSTLVVLLNQAFTEKVNVSVGKGIAKKVGRTIVKDKIHPMFENLTSEFKD